MNFHVLKSGRDDNHTMALLGLITVYEEPHALDAFGDDFNVFALTILFTTNLPPNIYLNSIKIATSTIQAPSRIVYFGLQADYIWRWFTEMVTWVH